MRESSWAAPALVALLALVASPAAADRGGYVIHRFDTQLTVEPNATLAVVERLEVEFAEPRHGLYRAIPVRYTDPRGFAYSLGLHSIRVTDEAGHRYDTQVSDEGAYKKIRIGDEDRTVEGRVVYVIRYRVRDAIGHFPDHDEIYWNATGNEWNTTIGTATTVVRLPVRLAQDQLESAVYTGRFGSRERDGAISHPEPGVVRFESAGRFAPLEGMTVAVGWPHGHVRFPTALERAARLLADNWVVLLPIGWLVFLLRRYRRLGRDPDASAPVMVQYEPPPGLSPGGVGTLIDESVDLADISATVVDLAVRRHLTIHQEERPQLFGILKRDETVFRRESPPAGDSLAPHEEKVMTALFAGGGEVAARDLANKFYAHIPGIRVAIYERLVKDRYFDASPEKVRSSYLMQGFLAGIVTGLLSAGWMRFRGVGEPAVPLIPLIVGALVLGLFAAFSSAMPRRTEAGVRARRWALGFQEYAGRVEGDRLDRSARDPRATFEALLPFAMALGVGGEWAKRFEGIYQQDEPRWYVGPHAGRGFSTHSFERSLSSAMTRAGQSMTASPRSSSGSGGGGSSGGGGGGGGGGSW
ncbi:MAG: DUF2207 domain-containing protein [Candidatus Eisenbacteria bacterium]